MNLNDLIDRLPPVCKHWFTAVLIKYSSSITNKKHVCILISYVKRYRSWCASLLGLQPHLVPFDDMLFVLAKWEHAFCYVINSEQQMLFVVLVNCSGAVE